MGGLTGFFERTKKSYNPKIKEILMLTKKMDKPPH
jgi:hypothetical protein